MIEELRITSLGVIDESVLELGPGFTAITGETGAGKTMVVTALGLLLGGRSDAGTVRTGARLARVEGTLQVDKDSIASEIEDLGGEIEDGSLLVARQVSSEGRSRAYVGGAAVPAARLGDLVAPLVAVHGQSDQHRLLAPSAQRDALDTFAGDEARTLRDDCGRLYRALGEAERDLAAVIASARERAREADLLRFGLGEVAAVGPQEGEDLRLADEERRLGFADTIRAAAERARGALSTDDGGPDALALVGDARRALDSVRDHDSAAAELADRLAELSYLLSDLAADVASYATGLETDPARLAAVSERRAALTALTRKYGASIEEVLAWAADAALRLERLDDTDGEIARLTAERDRLRAEAADCAGRLSAVRTEAAVRLAEAVTAEIHHLAMPYARIVIDVRQQDDPAGLTHDGRTVRFGATGIDEVELLLAANQGSAPRPLGKGASGGELSRVMLGVEVALAATHPVPTFVFDEVDAGVGGAAAVEIGRRLGLLARHAQVVVVTHLPQVAAFADRHVVVEKSTDGTVTRSGLTTLDEPGRVRELSRMLAGLEDSDTARAHAEELLAEAREATR